MLLATTRSLPHQFLPRDLLQRETRAQETVFGKTCRKLNLFDDAGRRRRRRRLSDREVASTLSTPKFSRHTRTQNRNRRRRRWRRHIDLNPDTQPSHPSHRARKTNTQNISRAKTGWGGGAFQQTSRQARRCASKDVCDIMWYYMIDYGVYICIEWLVASNVQCRIKKQPQTQNDSLRIRYDGIWRTRATSAE